MRIWQRDVPVGQFKSTKTALYVFLRPNFHHKSTSKAVFVLLTLASSTPKRTRKRYGGLRSRSRAVGAVFHRAKRTRSRYGGLRSRKRAIGTVLCGAKQTRGHCGGFRCGRGGVIGV